MSESAAGIGGRTLRGMAWAYGSYAGGRLLVLVSTAVLARLLAPEEFGLVALALTFIGLLDLAVDFGLGPALVIAPDEDLDRRADTVFISTVTIGAVLTVVIAAMGPFLADFFSEPELVGIAAALGGNFLLRSLGTTHYALAQRRLDFKGRTIAEFADVIVRATAGIVLALLGFGAWSLVIGYLLGTLALVIAIWVVVEWRPRPRFSGDMLRGMIGFGGAITGLNLTAAVISNVDYMFIGKLLGSAALGLYTLAFRLPELIVLNISNVAGQVLFPAMSAVAPADRGPVFMTTFRYTALITIPVAVGLVLLAEPFVIALFGSQWADSVVVMQILSIYALTIALGTPGGQMLKATGRASILFGLALVRLAVIVGLLIAFADLGIEVVAACQAAVAGAAELVSLLIATRMLDVRAREWLGALVVPVTASVVMAIPVGAAALLIDSPWLALLAGGVAGAAAFVLAVRVMAPQLITYVRERIRRPASGPADPAPPGALGSRETDVIA
ncbi:lipopolysaccharide biosynthesis protein [Thermoleophilia bacterium SCSIO 60948]|nr:lipopolysaccharide biosynthesis protein [Thermoleophilia bacterium SCSIO 60948]